MQTNTTDLPHLSRQASDPILPKPPSSSFIASLARTPNPKYASFRAALNSTDSFTRAAVRHELSGGADKSAPLTVNRSQPNPDAGTSDIWMSDQISNMLRINSQPSHSILPQAINSHPGDTTLLEQSIPDPSLDKPQPWVSLFKRTPRNAGRYSPKHYENIVRFDGISYPPKSIIDASLNYWKNTLVGFFLDEGFDYDVVRTHLRRRWRLKGKIKMRYDKQLFFFDFTCEDDRSKILTDDPIVIDGRIFIVMAWSPSIDTARDRVKSIPVWTKIYNIPSCLQPLDGLDWIASHIGRPICFDESTIRRDRLDYAKGLIEISSECPPPSRITICLPDATIAHINVLYQWKPKICLLCHSFGHDEVSCRHRTSTVGNLSPTDSQTCISRPCYMVPPNYNVAAQPVPAQTAFENPPSVNHHLKPMTHPLTNSNTTDVPSPNLNRHESTHTAITLPSNDILPVQNETGQITTGLHPVRPAEPDPSSVGLFHAGNASDYPGQNIPLAATLLPHRPPHVIDSTPTDITAILSVQDLTDNAITVTANDILKSHNETTQASTDHLPDMPAAPGPLTVIVTPTAPFTTSNNAPPVSPIIEEIQATTFTFHACMDKDVAGSNCHVNTHNAAVSDVHLNQVTPFADVDQNNVANKTSSDTVSCSFQYACNNSPTLITGSDTPSFDANHPVVGIIDCFSADTSSDIMVTATTRQVENNTPATLPDKDHSFCSDSMTATSSTELNFNLHEDLSADSNLPSHRILWYHYEGAWVHEDSDMHYSPSTKTFYRHITDAINEQRFLIYHPDKNDLIVCDKGKLGKHNRRIFRDEKWDRKFHYKANSPGYTDVIAKLFRHYQGVFGNEDMDSTPPANRRIFRASP